MRCMQLLVFLHQRTKDHRVQLGAQAEQSHAKKKKKSLAAVRRREAESAALLQRAAKTLMPKTHRIYNGATIIHTKPMQRTANVITESWGRVPPSAFFLFFFGEVKTLQKEKFNLIG